MREESNNKKNKSKESSFSNTKARGVILLIASLLIFQIGTFIFKVINEPTNNGKPENKEFYRNKGFSARPDISDKKGAEPKASKLNKLFRFNPNTINLDSLILLGFSPKQAQSILNYRNKGGRFFKKTDFAKMYVVSDEKYAALENWIDIPEKNFTVGFTKDFEKDSAKSSAKSFVNGSTKRFAQDTVKYTAKYSVKDSSRLWLCNLNSADSSQLVKLYGIGPYFAKKILNYRQRLGGSFVNTEQLLEIEGIDKEKYTKFEQKLFIDTTQINRYSIEECERTFMEQHPYIGAYAARGIILYRENRKTANKGKITLNDLVNEHILSPEAASRLYFYIK